MRRYFIYLLLLLAIFLFQYSPPDNLSQWQKIEARGYLTWVTRPSPLTYYSSLDGIIGLEYDIIKGFCQLHGLQLNVVTSSSNAELFTFLDSQEADVAGANLVLTKPRASKYITTIGYDETFVVLVSSLAYPKIKSIADMGNYQGAVLNDSSYLEIANSLPIDNLQISKGMSLYEILTQVINDEIDYTFADSNIIEIYKYYMPKLRIGLQLSRLEKLVFLLSNNIDLSFKHKLDEYIESYINTNRLAEYKQLIKNNLPNSRPANTATFLKNYKKRWPLIKPMVYRIADKYSISPILLAAISYQESHWNPKAISPTLVKGLMMLTLDVAAEQNVTDRSDPLQSLEGGTKYFIKMTNKIPQRIIEPDKTNFALAAYNLGYSNLEKARRMTQGAGKNPDLWSDVREFLIKFNSMKNISADGKTAVSYVENIHVYENLLQWKEQQ